MPYSESQKRATLKYKAKAYEHIDLSVKKGQRDKYKAQAAAHGLSLNAYIISLLEKDSSSVPVLAETNLNSSLTLSNEVKANLDPDCGKLT